MTRSVTHRDLPKNIDPVDFLFGDVKITVPESRFTPELKVRFYERTLRTLNVKALHNKGDSVPYGLESLPSLLRYEPSYSGPKWFKLEAPTEVIESALPSKTPYQLQYLTLFGFPLPKWKDIPLVAAQEADFANLKVLGEIEAVTLLFGKNKQLYFVTARWSPEKGYFGGGKEPYMLECGPYVFRLSQLRVEVTDWKDHRILEKIENGQWSDIGAFKANLRLVLGCTADILETRARNMRRAADRLSHDVMPIYFGR